TFQRLHQQVVDLVDDAKGDFRGEHGQIPPEVTHRERIHGVTGVDGQGGADASVHGRLAASRQTAVLDVVVHQEGVVEELEAGGRGQRRLGAAAVGPTG